MVEPTITYHILNNDIHMAIDSLLATRLQNLYLEIGIYENNRLEITNLYAMNDERNILCKIDNHYMSTKIPIDTKILYVDRLTLDHINKGHIFISNLFYCEAESDDTYLYIRDLNNIEERIPNEWFTKISEMNMTNRLYYHYDMIDDVSSYGEITNHSTISEIKKSTVGDNIKTLRVDNFIMKIYKGFIPLLAADKLYLDIVDIQETNRFVAMFTIKRKNLSMKFYFTFLHLN